VMGNGVCFGAVDWTTNSALDIEDMAKYQDMVQIEAQDRARVSTDMVPKWQSPTWTGEEACYMTSVTEDKPIWIVVSYFKAWPWRRAAVDYAEQKAFMAQIIANGASPMVNTSGGPPKVHEDQRGFQAPSELYNFMKKHAGYFDGDRSGANVALVYSQETLVYYGRTEKEARYLEGFRGFEKALQENHIPFDIISTKVLDEKHLARYRVLILPTLACMSKEIADALRGYADRGGSIVATFETGLYDLAGVKRDDFIIGDLLGAKYVETSHVNGDKPDGKQNYSRLQACHELLAGLEGTELVPEAGKFCRVESAAGTIVPLKLAQPFIVFPEGLSYTAEPDLGYPMMIATEHPGGGRTVYLPGQIDKHHWRAGFADLSQILCNTVKWSAKGEIPIACDGPNTIYVSLRRQDGRNLVHLVNLTGGQRYFKQMIPLYDIEVKIEKSICGDHLKACMLSDSKILEIVADDRYYTITVPKLTDYDVLVIAER
ncbi:MAG TPA: beta-galactosidase trimerization domain-containing protein, partial [Clostridia bacterium]